MPVERAPYLIYSESVATVDYDINSDADVLAIIAPTRFAKNLSNSVIESETLYKLKIYSEQEGTTLVGNCTCKLVETESETHIQLMVVESDSDSITVDTKYFVVKDAKTDESVMYELFSSVGSTNTSANKYAKLSTEVVTKWYTPTIKEDELLVFNKYSLASVMIESEELKKVLKDFFLENAYYSQADNLGVPKVMVVPIPENPTVANVIDAYKLLRKYRKITAIGCVGMGESPNLSSLGVTLRTYLMEDQVEGQLKIVYIKAPEKGADETIDDYATKIANLNQRHIEGEGSDATEVDGANSSRIAFIEPKHYGTLLAKICNTQYFLEPGYLPINSLTVGEFDVLSNDERDKLCMSGLIFGEDDVLLPTTVPRICLGVSSSFGRPYSVTADGYETRPADGLIHARRNVDHHVREILGILAYQLKRNETSVSIDYIKNQVMSYFEAELGKGTIQAYSFNVGESSWNPYCLLITGAIIPINATLAIESSNRIEAPYMVASNYV